MFEWDTVNTGFYFGRRFCFSVIYSFPDGIPEVQTGIPGRCTRTVRYPLELVITRRGIVVFNGFFQYIDEGGRGTSRVPANGRMRTRVRIVFRVD